jgi:hypothetical protein
MVKHAETHPSLDVPGCFGCKVATVAVAASATPTRSAGASNAARINATEARWDRDMPAYKRLVQSGVQPAQIDGCAHLEATATERHQIEGGVNPQVVERVLNR